VAGGEADDVVDRGGQVDACRRDHTQLEAGNVAAGELGDGAGGRRQPGEVEGPGGERLVDDQSAAVADRDVGLPNHAADRVGEGGRVGGHQVAERQRADVVAQLDGAGSRVAGGEVACGVDGGVQADACRGDDAQAGGSDDAAGKLAHGAPGAQTDGSWAAERLIDGHVAGVAEGHVGEAGDARDV